MWVLAGDNCTQRAPSSEGCWANCLQLYAVAHAAPSGAHGYGRTAVHTEVVQQYKYSCTLLLKLVYLEVLNLVNNYTIVFKFLKI